MICDATNDNAGNCQYFEIAKHQEATMLDGVFSEERVHATAIGIPKLEGLWIVGGQGSSTSEIITKTGTQPGPPAPSPDLQNSCMVRIGRRHGIVTTLNLKIPKIGIGSLDLA